MIKILKLTKEQITENKKQVIELLRSTNRKGMDGLLKCMENGGYFTARCGSHHKYPGGLMMHSLTTCKIALSKGEGLSRDSIIICTLLHDLCDIRGFHEFPNHDERSMHIAMAHIELSSAERCAIRNHMRNSHNWDNVLAIPENKALYKLVYDADKASANHDNPLPRMKHVSGGKISVKYTNYDRIDEEMGNIQYFSISQEFITWGLWRFVMGKEIKPLADYHGSSNNLRDRKPLFGEIQNEDEKEFLRRLKEMTGIEFSFPTLLQWEAARRQRACSDLGKKYELVSTSKQLIIVGGENGNAMPCAPNNGGGIDWDNLCYHLIING